MAGGDQIALRGFSWSPNGHERLNRKRDRSLILLALTLSQDFFCTAHASIDFRIAPSPEISDRKRERKKMAETGFSIAVMGQSLQIGWSEPGLVSSLVPPILENGLRRAVVSRDCEL